MAGHKVGRETQSYIRRRPKKASLQYKIEDIHVSDLISSSIPLTPNASSCVYIIGLTINPF